MPYKGIDWKVEIHNAVEMGKQGMSFNEIASKYGVSAQRIQQVFAKASINPHEVGVRLRGYQTREAKAAARWKKYGDESQDLYDIKWEKFRSKRNNAIRRGQEFTIYFSDIDCPHTVRYLVLN